MPVTGRPADWKRFTLDDPELVWLQVLRTGGRRLVLGPVVLEHVVGAGEADAPAVVLDALAGDVDFTDEHLTAALPKKYIDDNIAAIKYGYGLTPDSIKQIVAEQAASTFAGRYAEKVLAGVAPAEAVELAAAPR